MAGWEGRKSTNEFVPRVNGLGGSLSSEVGELDSSTLGFELESVVLLSSTDTLWFCLAFSDLVLAVLSALRVFAGLCLVKKLSFCYRCS